jgi:hypothetical protein
MTLPAIFFGVVLSTAYGTAFHFWKGGSLNKLFYYVILAWLGFWIGHFVGGLIGWSFAAIGPLNTGMATLGSLAVLVAGDWLGRIEVTTK